MLAAAESATIALMLFNSEFARVNQDIARPRPMITGGHSNNKSGALEATCEKNV
jgi:hypothetical protein